MGIYTKSTDGTDERWEFDGRFSRAFHQLPMQCTPHVFAVAWRVNSKFTPVQLHPAGDIGARVGPDNSVVKRRVRGVGTNSVSPGHQLRAMPAWRQVRGAPHRSREIIRINRRPPVPRTAPHYRLIQSRLSRALSRSPRKRISVSLSSRVLRCRLLWSLPVVSGKSKKHRSLQIVCHKSDFLFSSCNISKIRLCNGFYSRSRGFWTLRLEVWLWDFRHRLFPRFVRSFLWTVGIRWALGGRCIARGASRACDSL